MRGLTAWIVLQGAAPLDALKLKAALKDYPAAVEAASADGVSVLRITLKSPAQIGAHADGSNLKVVIAAQVNEQPIAIGFSRNQDDATHSSLSTLLPGATHPVMMIYSDPSATEFEDGPLLGETPYIRALLSAFRCPLRSVRSASGWVRAVFRAAAVARMS